VKEYLTPDKTATFPRKVFLDTQVFKSENFNFDARSLRLLKELSQEDRVSLFITDIVDREVRARIRREVEASRTWFNQLRKEARILLSAKGTYKMFVWPDFSVERSRSSWIIVKANTSPGKPMKASFERMWVIISTRPPRKRN
jgi:hypothetical protein